MTSHYHLSTSLPGKAKEGIFFMKKKRNKGHWQMNCSALSCQEVSGPVLASRTCRRLLTSEQTHCIPVIWSPHFTCISFLTENTNLTSYQQMEERKYYKRALSIPSCTRAEKELCAWSGSRQEEFSQPPPAAQLSHSRTSKRNETPQHPSTLHPMSTENLTPSDYGFCC